MIDKISKEKAPCHGARISWLRAALMLAALAVCATSSQPKTVMAAGDKTLYPKWKPIYQSISYVLNGATVSPDNPVSYNAGEPAFTLANPSKDGYDFAGWSGTGIEGYETNVTISQGSVGDRHYAAHWTPKQYQQTIKVRYENANGSWGSSSVVSTQTMGYGETCSYHRNADSTYQAADMAYIVDGPRETVVDVYRNTFTVLAFTPSGLTNNGVTKVTGSGTYRTGQTATVTATVASGHTWTKWRGTSTKTSKSFTTTTSGIWMTTTDDAGIKKSSSLGEMAIVFLNDESSPILSQTVMVVPVNNVDYLDKPLKYVKSIVNGTDSGWKGIDDAGALIVNATSNCSVKYILDAATNYILYDTEYVRNIDRAAPVFDDGSKSVSENERDAYGRLVKAKMHVEASDSGFGLHPAAYAITDDKDVYDSIMSDQLPLGADKTAKVQWQASGDFLIVHDGTYYVFARDRNGFCAGVEIETDIFSQDEGGDT